MEAAPKYWASPEGLKDTYLIPSRGGSAIPLAAVASDVPSTAPLAVNHTGLFPSVTVSFNLLPGVSLDQATKTIQNIQRQLAMPKSIHGQYSGTLQAYSQSLTTEPYLIMTAIFAVYIVLGILYESLIHPITILSTLPPASLGAILAMMLTKTELNVMSIIGIILLIGIVKKNAIMMIDFALNAERNEGKNTRDSIFEACMLRFRPIMMTTMAALFGAVPLAVGTGMGSELRRPLGISIIGGLIVSQVLTLYTTPVIYLFMDNLRLKLQRRQESAPVHPQRARGYLGDAKRQCHENGRGKLSSSRQNEHCGSPPGIEYTIELSFPLPPCSACFCSAAAWSGPNITRPPWSLRLPTRNPLPLLTPLHCRALGSPPSRRTRCSRENGGKFSTSLS